MEGNPKTYFVFNERSILISYNCPTNSKLISNISNTKKRIVTHMNDCIVDIVQSINSILVIFDRTKISADDLMILNTQLILKIWQKKKNYLHRKLSIFTNQKYMMFCQWDFYLVSCIWVLLTRNFIVKEKKFPL